MQNRRPRAYSLLFLNQNYLEQVQAFFLYLVGSGIAADRPIHAWNKYFR